MNREPQSLLEMRGIHKSFPGVHALKGVDLTLRAGEVLALLGENGAGKSTLMKVLGGAYHPDSGAILMDGKEVRIANPVAARDEGIAVIYQELNLVPSMTARENLFLGHETSRLGFGMRRKESREAMRLFEMFGVCIDPEARCRDLTVAQRQIVEIARALSVNARIIVMDEPSATLTAHEVQRLFEVISELKGRGIGVIYISHRLDEIFDVADRVMIMRDGEHVATRPTPELTRDTMIELMVGRRLDKEFPPREPRIGGEVMSVAGLNLGNKVRDVSFSVRSGEILTITGLVGAGRTEVARLIFGADRAQSGRIRVHDRDVTIRSPRAAIGNHVCLLTEDRKSQGLILARSSRENFGLPNLSKFSRLGFLRQAAERRAFGEYIRSLRIKIPYQEQLVRNLSGGNQQKVVLAKWLERDCDIVIFDEPTRGIDVGAKYEIYTLMNELAGRGKAIVMISSELPEVLGMSDRILVMCEGRIAGEITDVASATQEEIMDLAVA